MLRRYLKGLFISAAEAVHRICSDLRDKPLRCVTGWCWAGAGCQQTGGSYCSLMDPGLVGGNILCHLLEIKQVRPTQQISRCEHLLRNIYL